MRMMFLLLVLLLPSLVLLLCFTGGRDLFGVHSMSLRERDNSILERLRGKFPLPLLPLEMA
jgi:hypothetical protein